MIEKLDYSRRNKEILTSLSNLSSRKELNTEFPTKEKRRWQKGKSVENDRAWRTGKTLYELYGNQMNEVWRS